MSSLPAASGENPLSEADARDRRPQNPAQRAAPILGTLLLAGGAVARDMPYADARVSWLPKRTKLPRRSGRSHGSGGDIVQPEGSPPCGLLPANSENKVEITDDNSIVFVRSWHRTPYVADWPRSFDFRPPDRGAEG
jgi:hypothetical protein